MSEPVPATTDMIGRVWPETRAIEALAQACAPAPQPTPTPHGYWDCDCGRECSVKLALPDCRAEWVSLP